MFEVNGKVVVDDSGNRYRKYFLSLHPSLFLAEKHGLDTLLFCPNPWALRHVFINQETGKVVRARCNQWDCLYCTKSLSRGE